MLHDRVEQRALLAFVGDERVPDDDLGLPQHAEELRQQQQHRRHRHQQQADEVGQPAADGVPQAVAQPPRDDEHDRHHAAGDVHREHAEQGQHSQRDAVAVPQCRHDQDHGGRSDAVCGHVRHRRGVELHIRDGGERRRKGRRGRCRSGRPPLVGPRSHQLPRQHRGACGEQPDGGREGVQRVGGGRGGAGDLTLQRRERVERGRVVQRVVRLDIAQLTHVGRRGLTRVQDESDGVGVPDGVPGTRDRLPVRYPANCREADQQRAEHDARCDDQGRSHRHRGDLRGNVPPPYERRLQTCYDRHRQQQDDERGPPVPRHADGAHRQDRQTPPRRTSARDPLQRRPARLAVPSFRRLLQGQLATAGPLSPRTPSSLH